MTRLAVKVVTAQDVRDLQAKLAQMNTTSSVDSKGLEADFVKVAKKFSEARGISYGSWRDAAVPAVVLKKLGSPGRGANSLDR